MWKPPDPSHFKSNFDVAVFEDLQEAGIGVVIRNSSGEVVASMFEKVPLPLSVVTLETMAARKAVQFVQDTGLHSSIFESNSETSISALRHKSLLHSSYDHLIKDILSNASS